MGNNCSKQGEGSQDGGKKSFLDAYITRIAVIIEHYEVYQDFFDKVPGLICLAKEFLQTFISHCNESETMDLSELVTRLTTRSKQYVKTCLHQKIKQICQDLYQKAYESEISQIVRTNEAERMLRNYEINVLRIINRLSKPSFECCNHLKVAQQVIDELIVQVKRNGVNDNNGKSIKDYPSYIYKIVKSRMYDEEKRHQRLRSFPGGNFDHFESQHGKKLIDKIIINELHEYLRNQFFPKISNLEGFIFRTSHLEDGHTLKEIKESIYNIFGKDISEASISRTQKKLVEMIRDDFCFAPCEIDNIYKMINASNLKPLKSDWLFLFLDATSIDLKDDFGKRKKCTHFIGYGISTEKKEGILINKVFCGQTSLEQWQQVMQELKNRGMARLLMMLTGDYPKFVSFTREFFPKVDHQLSLFKLQKNAHKYLKTEDYTLFKITFDDILSCGSFDDAYDRLIGFCRKLKKTYMEFTNNLEEKAENFLAFIKYPSEIWKNINIFTIDEILNKKINSIRQNTKKRCYREEEFVAKTNENITQVFKSNLYDCRFKAVLPLLILMFNRRYGLSI